MSIIDIIFKKSEKEDNSQALIGTEIKLRRNALSKTLEEISLDTCSVSYLSKLENCEIKGNPLFLEEICRRVHLTSKNIDSIKQSKEIFQQALKSLYLDDNESMEKYYEQVFELKNYRAKMIKLMYQLKKGNLRVCKRIISELEKVESSMQLNDLILLGYLEAWNNFLCKNFYDSYVLLKSLIKVSNAYNFLDSLCLELITKIMYNLNSHLFLNFTNDLRNNYLSHNSFDKIIKLEELINRFYLNNGFISLVEERLKNVSYEMENIKIILSAYSDDKIIYSFTNYNYYKMIYLYSLNKELFKKTYETEAIECSEIEKMTIDLLYDKEFSDNFNEKIEMIYYPYAIKEKNYFFLNKVSEYLTNSLKRSSRYKKCLSVIDDIRMLDKESKDYC